MLRSQNFDLIVVSRLSGSDLHRVIDLSDGAGVLVLDAITLPSELISLVAQRLNRHQRESLAQRHSHAAFHQSPPLREK